jgi:DNA-binding IclR family transcriptional regulator
MFLVQGRIVQLGKPMASQTSGTVSKALSVLDQFLTGPTELSLSELSARTAMHKTTVLRLCASLEGAGFLQHAPGMPYRLGPKIWQLAQAYRVDFQLEDIVRPLLRAIRDRTGESVSFYTPDGDERVCRFRENSRAVIRHHLEEGARLPLAAGVVGRVLKAYLGGRGKEYDEIRRDGHLIAQGREAHTTSVAVPVLDLAGTIRGGLVVSGPSIRFRKCEEALALLKDAAATMHASFPFAPDRDGMTGRISSPAAGRGAGAGAATSLAKTAARAPPPRAKGRRRRSG